MKTANSIEGGELATPWLSATNLKDFTLTILNGTSLGIILALIPAALTSQILPLFGTGTTVKSLLMLVTVVQSLLPVIAAFAVGHAMKFDVMDSASLALATFASSGVLEATNTGFQLAGIGAMLNIIFVLFISSALILLIHDRLGQLRIIVEPVGVLLIGGWIGLQALPVMVAVQNWVGELVAGATTFTPILMGMVLDVAFGVLIISPLSSVGIATAITLTGIGSGAANTGIIVTSFVLAAMGASVNSFGGTIAHFVGSPKIQMANMLEHPILFVPVVISSAISGAAAAMLGVGGTPFSAGFGISGLVGPLTSLRVSTGAGVPLRVLLAFVVIPVVIAWIVSWLFVKKLHVIKPESLKLPL